MMEDLMEMDCPYVSKCLAEIEGECTKVTDYFKCPCYWVYWGNDMNQIKDSETSLLVRRILEKNKGD